MLDFDKVVGDKEAEEYAISIVEFDAKIRTRAELRDELEAYAAEMMAKKATNDKNYIISQALNAFLEPRLKKRKADKAKAEKAAKRAEKEASKKVTNIKTKAA